MNCKFCNAELDEGVSVCPQCGKKLTFMEQQMLDNSPMRDGLLSSTFDVQPAVCQGCGKLEFYDPRFARRNKFIAYLIRKDTGE